MRAGLIKQAQDWAWGGPYARRHRGKPFPLADWPVDRPRDWTAAVNESMLPKQLEALRTSVNRGRAWGEPDWVQRTAARLSLAFTLRNPGRKKKKGHR